MKDEVGNATTITIIAKIDKTPPELTIGEYNQNWTKDDITINLEQIDSSIKVLTEINNMTKDDVLLTPFYEIKNWIIQHCSAISISLRRR